MKILAVDAAGKALSVAVAEDGRIVASAALNVGLTHSQRLLPLLQSLLAAADLSLAEIDMLAGASSSGGNFQKMTAALLESAQIGDTEIQIVQSPEPEE